MIKYKCVFLFQNYLHIYNLHKSYYDLTEHKQKWMLEILDKRKK